MDVVGRDSPTAIGLNVPESMAEDGEEAEFMLGGDDRRKAAMTDVESKFLFVLCISVRRIVLNLLVLFSSRGRRGPRKFAQSDRIHASHHSQTSR